ncbi:MAG TPA: thioredoxin domain-containing protein [Mycobacteriales bacterium]|nr:thioredoxin domain-containing protein [Mycobacteriales bacterium]
MPNRLADQTSPYLLQHQDNPVDWWPWSPEAFAEAERRGVPILLSVGYAACHWCHVMAHESFEDDDTAAVMNEHFVNIKVDREERPDVDAVYMEATQAMTGHGGWPMTVFMTPDGEPFFCGTYFPPTDRHGMPSFRRLLQSVAHAWDVQREQVTASAADIVERLSQRGPRLAGGEVDADLLDSGARSLSASYDGVRGGFGGAPKFPPSMALEFLLRHAARTGAERSLEMVRHTCERMARGGMYDQLAGGFARYSVDADWVVPHFEKMLYDNALLARVYLHLWRATGDELARRIALETCDFIVRDLGTPEGGFSSALDADSEGEEGKFYVWSPDELVELLGEDDGRWAASLLEVTEGGTFEHGRSVLQLLADPDDDERWSGVRRRLTEARATRIPPGRDDKVVAAWNGLAIAALAESGTLLDRPDLVAAASRAADLLLSLHWDAGGRRLLRTSREGRAGTNAGVLEDYADCAEGLLALGTVTGDADRITTAGLLLDAVLDRFGDEAGGFYDTAADAEALVRRPQDPTDNATPSGASAAAGALLTFAALTGSARHREAAERALGATAPIVAQHARFAGWAAAVAEALLAGPAEVAIVGEPGGEDTTTLERVARRSTSPGAVVVVGAPDGDASAVPLLADRPMRDGRATAYVCRGFVCAAPVTEPADLERQLAGG